MSLRVVILGVALAAAGGAGFLAMNMMGGEKQVAQGESIIPVAPAIKTDEVLVAAQNIDIGQKVDTALRWQEWPIDAISPDFITKSARPEAITELAPSIVRAQIVANEPVRMIKLLGADSRYMSSILPSGKRAVATQVAADTSAGGFILPNDYVDVIMTRRPANGGASFVTETILQNIRVLAIDQAVRENEEGQLVIVGNTATLELTPKQAEIITVAQQLADRLTLALRSTRDVDPDAKDESAEHLLGGGESGTINVIKGGQRTAIVGQ